MLQILYVYLNLTFTLDTGCGSSALPQRGHSPPPPVSPDAQLVFLPKRSAYTRPTRLPRHLRWLPLMISPKGRGVQQVFSGAMTHLPEPTPFQSCPHDSKLVYSIYLFIALGSLARQPTLSHLPSKGAIYSVLSLLAELPTTTQSTRNQPTGRG